MKHLPFVILCLALLTTTTTPLRAQQGQPTPNLPALPVIEALPEAEILPDVRLFSRTHPEKVLFAQLKLSKTTPDIDSFAKESPFVQKAQDIDKAAMILSEYNRIGNTYNLYNKNDTIVVHTILNPDEYSSLQDLIVFDELNDKTFFRFKMYGENIGIVPEDIQKFSQLQLSKPRANIFFDAVGSSGQVLAEIILKPVYATRKEPYKFRDEDYWLMFARIAEFRLWSSSKPDNAKLLWYYRADWYTPEDKSNIGGLYVKE